MGTFISELGKHLAEKWLTLLVLPGLLYTGVALFAINIGQTHSVDIPWLVTEASDLAGRLNAIGAPAMVLAAVTALLAAAAAGLAAHGLGLLVERVWLGNWPTWCEPVYNFLTDRRRKRWKDAHERYVAALTSERAAHLSDRRPSQAWAATRNQIALAEPARPTWIGDCIHAIDLRVESEYGLDLAAAWPRLWLVIPDASRSELRTARMDFDKAATLTAWGTLYGLLGLVWWPAVFIGLGTSTTGWRRGHEAIRILSELAEATVDIYGRDLATALGVTLPDSCLTPETGHVITRRLRKGA